jgi:hypothetical protein
MRTVLSDGCFFKLSISIRAVHWDDPSKVCRNVPPKDKVYRNFPTSGPCGGLWAVAGF